MPETQIMELAGPDLFGHTHALSDILIASVAEGAAISFLQPLSRQEATRFLEDEIFPEVQRGRRVLFGALSGQQWLCCTNRLNAEVPLSPDGLIPLLP